MCCTPIMNLIELPKKCGFKIDWLFNLFLPSDRWHNGAKADMILHRYRGAFSSRLERLAVFIVSNRVSHLNTHWENQFVSYNAVYVGEREIHTHTIEPSLWWQLLRKSSWLLLYIENSFFCGAIDIQKRHLIIQVAK